MVLGKDIIEPIDTREYPSSVSGDSSWDKDQGWLKAGSQVKPSVNGLSSETQDVIAEVAT